MRQTSGDQDRLIVLPGDPGPRCLGGAGRPLRSARANFTPEAQALACASVVGRLVAPGNESATYCWMKEKTSLGELLEAQDRLDVGPGCPSRDLRPSSRKEEDDRGGPDRDHPGPVSVRLPRLPLPHLQRLSLRGSERERPGPEGPLQGEAKRWPSCQLLSVHRFPGLPRGVPDWPRQPVGTRDPLRPLPLPRSPEAHPSHGPWHRHPGGHRPHEGERLSLLRGGTPSRGDGVRSPLRKGPRDLRVFRPPSRALP